MILQIYYNQRQKLVLRAVHKTRGVFGYVPHFVDS
jgi:hypothetical protein